MKILLDECVPAQVRHAFPGHNLVTVQEQGWTGIKNGALLEAAESAGFDLFIVADKNLRHQQNLAGRRLAILELWTNHRPTLEKHFSAIRAAAEGLRPGSILPWNVLRPERSPFNLHALPSSRGRPANSQARQDAFARDVPRRSAIRLRFERIEAAIEFRDLLGREVNRRRLFGDAVP